MKEVKCAFFDFDNTVAHGDTIYKLIPYTLKRHPLSVFRFIKTAVLGVGYAFHLVSMESLKSSILFPLDLLNEKEQEKFYRDVVEPSYYPHMLEELKKRQDEGCIVFLVTASSESYMRFNHLPIDVLMGTVTKKKNGHYTSKIIGKNCKGANKVDRINDYLKAHDLKIDYDHSYGYSDSESDIPMLKMVKNRYRVSLTDGSLSPFVF